MRPRTKAGAFFITDCYDECMKRSRLQRLTARLFLSLGYLMGTVGWLWVLLISVPPLIKTGLFDSLVSAPAPLEQVTSPASPLEASPLTWIIIGAVTLIILMLTVVILIRIPRTLVQGGEQLISHTTEAVIPVIVHHKPLPAKQRQALSQRIMLALQLGLSIAPLLISLFLPPYGDITRQIIITIASTLAVAAAVSFIFARLIGPKTASTSRTRSHGSRG